MDGAPDAVTPASCPEGPCELISGGPCPRGRACRYLTLDGRTLEPMCEGSHDRIAGQPCLTYDDCGPGLFCSELSFVCRSYCCGGSDDSCGGDTFCFDFWDGAGLCESDERCDLIGSTDCRDEKCVLVRDDGASMCLDLGGELEEGDPCTNESCGPGLQCLRAVGAPSSTCGKFCRLDNAAGCNVGDRCDTLEIERRPEMGICESVEDPCSGSASSGACTNTADCGIYEDDTLGTVAAVLSCGDGGASCIQAETGLSLSCATCFANLSDRAGFLSCAGF